MDRQRVFKTKRHLRKIVRMQLEKERIVIDNIKKTTTKDIDEQLIPSTFITDVNNKPIELNQNDADIYISNHSDVSISYPSFNIPIPCKDISVDFDFENTDTQSGNNFNSEVLLQKVKEWILKYRNLLSSGAINELLKIFNMEGFNNFPLDSRTLLKTPRLSSQNIIPLDNGSYAHLGIGNGIKNIYENTHSEVKDNEILNISLNIDGLPLTKSSNSQFWPILLSIDSDSEYLSRPFIVGAYHGFKKPDSIVNFLKLFVEEFHVLQMNGLQMGDKRVFPKLSKIICDAPAKSFLLCIKGHTGSSSCTKCVVEGEFFNKRMCFNRLNAPLRTDETFKQKSDESFHKENSISPLESLDVGLVTQVPLDYMHLICLGVMKKMLKFWVQGRKGIRLEEENLNLIKLRIFEFRAYIPSEFARLPRDLKEVDRFKATEFRMILLYLGPIIFQNILPKSKYLHFMALHCAMRILCSPNLYLVYNDFANNLLVYFVQNFARIYGSEYVSHNIHNLIHISNDCKSWGVLDNFSAFKFENFLYDLKKTIKFSRYPLQQLLNRLKENQHQNIIEYEYPQLKREIAINVERNGNDHIICYKTILFKNFQIILNNKDSCVTLEDDSVCLINGIYENIISKEIFVQGKKFLEYKAFYETPCSSMELFNIQVVKNLSEHNISIPIQKIKQKCLKYPLDPSSFVIIPLLHKETV